MLLKKMIEHSVEVHGMARAKPPWDKGGDWGPEYRSVYSSRVPGRMLLLSKVPTKLEFQVSIPAKED